MDSDVKVVVCAVLIAFVVVAAFIGWLCFYAWRVRSVLRAWAAEGGFQIVRFEKRNLTGRGAFNWWTNSPEQIIYHLRVRDKEGRERIGWVRCGSYFGGVLFSNKVEVKWEDH
jgi:hypothetical protein